MPSLRIRVPSEDLRPGLDAIRREMRVPAVFPPEVEAEAAAVAGGSDPMAAARRDARDLPLLTIDPPGSRDLDQAFHAERLGSGFRIRYAIADVAAFLTPGGAVDAEAWARGQTIYMPDHRAPLHPAALSEGVASLLPDQDRPAVLWTIDLDETGEMTDARLERALVRSRQAFGYAEAQAAIDHGEAVESLMLLADIGPLRQGIEREHEGIALNLPTQEVTSVEGGYRFSFEAPLPVEGWNAQISLLSGYCAAGIMLDGGSGILRTLPPVSPDLVAKLQRVGKALGIAWPEVASLGDVVRVQDGGTAAGATFLSQAARALRGAAYGVIEPGSAPSIHGGLGRHYAHVTAPLRRLADRYANEMVLAHCGGTTPPGWAAEALPRLPEAMAEADRRADAVEAAVLNLAEAIVMRTHIGETFTATVVDLNKGRASIQLREPPVVTKIDAGELRLGQDVDLRLTAVDPIRRTLGLQPV